MHRSEAVKAFLRHKPGRVHLEYLPAYSPTLNPVELVWSHLKRSLKNLVFTDLNQLQHAVLKQINQLHRRPDLIRFFFRKKEIGFITT
ncbi:transposase [Siphonobacter sp. SORGH_AS_0500]|uniref:transposase n=1 Tax=Siphonobacter sp. SORGH_AS_0500 TaxID=1864824 RepID=UPI0038F64BE1